MIECEDEWKGKKKDEAKKKETHVNRAIHRSIRIYRVGYKRHLGRICSDQNRAGLKGQTLLLSYK